MFICNVSAVSLASSALSEDSYRSRNDQGGLISGWGDDRAITSRAAGKGGGLVITSHQLQFDMTIGEF